jgi:aminopeptidase
MNKELLIKYARLAVRTGINLKRGQTLVISAPIECADFVRAASEIAFQEGARDVVINWKDELSQRIRYINAPEEIFDEFPEWQRRLYVDYSSQGAAFLSVYAEDPELLNDVNPERIAKATRTRNIALKEYFDRTMRNRNQWCVISIPTAAWAMKVFPGASRNDAVEKLWDAILNSVRITADRDPVEAWKVHKNNLNRHLEYLNSNRFRLLRYKNSLGTDLTIELPENHIWTGGSDFTPEGHEFIANMPTEEVYTLPLKTGVNGTAVSSMPLNYNGRLVKNFSLTFRDGRIIDYTAGEGYDVLKTLIESDEGSRYLGEVALVPVDSPISRSGIMFYNTLFDENASCHLAIGRAYPTNLVNGGSMSPEELAAAGVNDSIVHEDFMIGTEDLEITGVTASGLALPIFRDGRFSY